MNFYQRMGISPLKKCVNRDKCSFTTKQRMFGVFAINEILRYRWTRFASSRTLCHPACKYNIPKARTRTRQQSIQYVLAELCLSAKTYRSATPERCRIYLAREGTFKTIGTHGGKIWFRVYLDYWQNWIKHQFSHLVCIIIIMQSSSFSSFPIGSEGKECLTVTILQFFNIVKNALEPPPTPLLLNIL